MGGGSDEGAHCGGEGGGEGDADVVDCGCWGGGGGVEGGVCADCVGEVEGGEVKEVGAN